MRTFTCLFIALCISSFPCDAGGRERGEEPGKPVTTRLAVLDFEFEGISESEAKEYVDLITRFMKDLKDYEIIGGEDLKAKISELEDKPGAKSELNESPLETGRAVSAHQIVVGLLAKESGPYIVDIDLIDTQSEKILNGVSKHYASLSDLYSDAEELVIQLLDPPIRLEYREYGYYYSVYTFEGEEFYDSDFLLQAIVQKGNLSDEVEAEIHAYRARQVLELVGGLSGLAFMISGTIFFYAVFDPHWEPRVQAMTISGSAFAASTLFMIIGLSVDDEPHKVFELYNRQESK
jgi:hypothetical protein